MIIYGGECGVHDYRFRCVAEDFSTYLREYIEAPLVQLVWNGVFMGFVYHHNPFPMAFQVLRSECDERFVLVENLLSLDV